MKACCLAGSSLRDIASGLRCSSPRRCTSAISPERLSQTTPNSCSIHAPGRPRQGVADPRLQRHLLLQGQLAGATPVLEAGQAIDPVCLEKPVPRPDRIVVDQQHPTNILAAHPAIQQHQRVRPTGQTMLSQPVPSQLGQRSSAVRKPPPIMVPRRILPSPSGKRFFRYLTESRYIRSMVKHSVEHSERAGQQRLDEYLDELATALGHADREAPFRSYCLGLLLDGERKSVEPMAARL